MLSRNDGKRNLFTPLALFAGSFALAVFSALAFANNVAAVVRWWRVFLASGGDTQALASRVSGPLAWLDWSVVDYSAVTTFIPFVGFTAMAVAAFRLLRGRRIRAEAFPFFRGSDQLFIALGLFGTLWGIIVIGYFRLDTVRMADLMQCLHTALFSTLTAVVWVFMVDRPLVRPFFLRVLERSGLAETDDGDLAAAVDRLVARLGAASDAFERRQREYERAFEARQKEYAEFFARRIAELEAKAGAADRRAAEAQAKVAEMVRLAGSWSGRA